MYKVIKDFRGSPDGCRVIDYEKGQKLDIDTDSSQAHCEVAVMEKWVVEIKSKKTGKAK